MRKSLLLYLSGHCNVSKICKNFIHFVHPDSFLALLQITYEPKPYNSLDGEFCLC